MKKIKAILASLLTLAAAGQVLAADSPQSTSSAAGRQTALSKADQKFLTQAAQLNLAEIENSKYAVQKATRNDVKEYAGMLASEHQMAFGELSMLAERKGFALPTSIARDQQNSHNKLVSQTGADLDKAFLKTASDAHEETIDLYKKAAEGSDDGDIRALANKQLPKLTQHLESAKQLKKSMD